MKTIEKFVKKALSFSFNLYFPHEGNNFKARVLHPSGLFFVKVGLIAFQIVMQFLIFSPFPKILGYAANISIEEVIRLTNQKRAEVGLPPLKEDLSLSSSALLKGQHMLQQDYWAHVAPDGTEPWSFFLGGGYKYRYAGENLARDFSDAQSAVEAWMASPSHRENILSDRYKDIGIAVVEGDLAGTDSTIIVQFMGTRYADTLPAEPIAQKTEASPSPSSTPSSLALTVPSNLQTPTPLESKGAQKRVLISPFTTTKGVSLTIVGVLITILAVDGLVTSRRRIKRVAGRTFAHMAFLGMIMMIVLILKAGEVV